MTIQKSPNAVINFLTTQLSTGVVLSEPLGLEAEMGPAVWCSAQELQLTKPVSQDPPSPDSDEVEEPVSQQQ